MQSCSRRSMRALRAATHSPQQSLLLRSLASSSKASGGSKEPSNVLEGAETKPQATVKAENEEKVKKPRKGMRGFLESLDEMVEEADRKVEKKYRPNMFAEFKQFNDTNGKVVEGPFDLTEVSNARTVTSLPVTNLEGDSTDMEKLVARGKVSLVLTSFKNNGLNALPAWRESFLRSFAANPHVQVFTLSIIEEWYMQLVKPSILNGLRKRIPKEFHAHSYAYFGRKDKFRTSMDMYNSFVGYAHLVDGKGRIRWIAGGEATEKELKRMYNATSLLLEQNAQSRRR